MQFAKTGLCAVFSLGLCGGLVRPAQAFEVSAPLSEIAQAADLIFSGNVIKQECRWNEQGTAIFTEVTFGEVRIIHGRNGSSLRVGVPLTLRFAGGTLDGLTQVFGCVPRLDSGRRYLMFSYDNSREYISPVVSEGLFEILRDSADGTEYVFRPGGWPVESIEEDRPRVGKVRIQSMAQGRPTWAAAEPELLPMRGTVIPTAERPGHSATESRLEVSQPVRPMTLSSFESYVLNTALKAHLAVRLLHKESSGHLYERDRHGNIVSRPVPLAERSPARVWRSSAPEAAGAGGRNPGLVGSTSVPDQTVPNAPTSSLPETDGYCQLGIQLRVPPYPLDEWSVTKNMYDWNRMRDIIRLNPYDGWNPHNSRWEVAGFCPDEYYYRDYGFHYGSAVAVTWGWKYSGSQMWAERDILWDSARSWTYDPDIASSNPGILLVRDVNLHEMGHVWGEDHPNGYNFTVNTVMSNGRPVENGAGVHPIDAYKLRRLYLGQPNWGSIPSTIDIGVESYYASMGVYNAWLNDYDLHPGEAFTVYHMTVENNSYSDVSNLRLTFYASTDRTITEDDLEIGEFNYSTFAREDYRVPDVTMLLPNDIAPGTYYLGAIVSLDGQPDGFAENNATYLRSPFTVQTGSQCIAAGIQSQPADQTIAQGGTATLSVTAAGTGPLHYQWYTGPAGDTSDPVGADNGSYATPSLFEDETYWVRVWNGCGTVDSRAATIRAQSSDVPPEIIWFQINGGAPSTRRSRVALNSDCLGAPVEYMASRSASFGGAAWQAYAGTVQFDLDRKRGRKTVYFKVRDAAGRISSTTADSIMKK